MANKSLTLRDNPLMGRAVESAMLGFPSNWLDDYLLSAVNGVTSTYPPYDIIQFDTNHYQIVFAVAGFSKDDLDIQVEQQRLTVSGKQEQTDESDENSKSSYRVVHKGISSRKFQKSFLLGEHMKISKAEYVDGLLKIDVVREVPPEALPKTIQIA